MTTKVLSNVGEPQETLEPETFAERARFVTDVNREYLKGRISWQSLWYYEQRYAFKRDGHVETVLSHGEVDNLP